MPRYTITDMPSIRAPQSGAARGPGEPSASEAGTPAIHLSIEVDAAGALAGFSEQTRAWFSQAFEAPTPAQAGAWQSIAAGAHTLVVAPTGSGKTLAAFLTAIDQIITSPVPTQPGTRCRIVYVSPLKALASDVERNLRSPIAGIAQAAARAGVEVHLPVVASRSGDTSAAGRRDFMRGQADLLITTPESLYLLLTSQAREQLRGVTTVIIDEVHAVAGTKRGAHLAVSLERLDALLPAPAQRVGLSATVRPVEEVARFLTGGAPLSQAPLGEPVGAGPRPVRVVAPPSSKTFDLRVEVPVPDLAEPPPAPIPTAALRGPPRSGRSSIDGS